MFVRDNFEYESGGISNHLMLQKTEARISQIARREVDDAAEINKLLNGLKDQNHQSPNLFREGEGALRTCHKPVLRNRYKHNCRR